MLGHSSVTTTKIYTAVVQKKLAEEMIKIRPDTPIILCTGFSDKIDENKL